MLLYQLPACESAGAPARAQDKSQAMSSGARDGASRPRESILARTAGSTRLHGRDQNEVAQAEMVFPQACADASRDLVVAQADGNGFGRSPVPRQLAEE